MTTHRYERGAIVGDYARGGLGFVITAGPALFVPMVSWLTVMFTGFALLFGVYVALTWMRASTVVEVDEAGIQARGPVGRAIAWNDLESVELRYFATRRDKEGGWMQMRLRGAGGAMAIESSLEGFEAVAERAAAAATRNQLALSPVTQENLKALGLLGGAGASGASASARDDGRLGVE